VQIATASPPDGYTLMMTSTAYGFLIDKPKVPVDLVNSFAPAAMIGFGESALVVHPSFPVKTVKDLIDLAKKRPGEILYSSSGIGGFPHMNTALFELKTGVKMVHAVQGRRPAIADVVAGHSQINFGLLSRFCRMFRASGCGLSRPAARSAIRRPRTCRRSQRPCRVTNRASGGASSRRRRRRRTSSRASTKKPCA
jgi:tripartite-type tricarboxylate transporter receptor subunit TctC